jgi:hypothetical protein
MAEEIQVLYIEGVLIGEEIKMRYKLPPVTSEPMKAFYRTFIVQLCENIAGLEGAENLFDIVEADDVKDD